MHAVVVDDHDMGVTHVIRGDDHLTNAGRQTIIYEAMGWNVPEWAHLSLIHGPDGAKLSKRHGALGVDAYRDMGYLPEALRNYLARLGWSHGDDEIFSTEQAAAWFELSDINKSAARFNFDKLQSLNGHYIRSTDDADLLRRLEMILPQLDGGGEFAGKLDKGLRARIMTLMPALKERARTLVDLFHSLRFLAADRPLHVDEKAAALLDSEARGRLARLAEVLDRAQWTVSDLEKAVREFSEAEGVKLGKIAQPLRAAVTGSAASPPIFDVLAVIGREESLARIKDQAA
jgi:glutamyl-tRNA synthetase